MARAQNIRNRKNSPNEYQLIRAGFVRRGTTIAEWARGCGVRPSTAYDALKGRRAGNRSNEIIAMAKEFIA